MTLPIEIENRIQPLRNEAEKAGIELVEVRYRRAGQRGVLTFIVDKPGGVTLDECAELNRRFGDWLDREAEADGREGFLQGSYFLEVNSPGLDRPLKTVKDFERAKNEPVRVAWRTDAGAGLVTVGRLREVGEENIELEDKQGRTVKIPFASVTKAHREVEI